MIYDNENGHAFRGHDGQPTGWRIVALDPRDFVYHDDDSRAMDETNWDAMVASFNSDTSLETVDGTDAFRGWFRDDVRAEADWGVLLWETMRGDDPDGDGVPDWTGRGGYREAWWSLGQSPRDVAGSLVNKTVLIVREDSDAWGEWEGIARRLANYPLLDEDAYFKREVEAWDEWWERDGFRDLVGHWRNSRGEEITTELIGRGVPDAGWLDDDGNEIDLADLVAELPTNPFASVAMEGMRYANGFSGEYDDDGAVRAFVDHLAAAWRLFELMGVVGHEYANHARGIVRLPMDYSTASQAS